MNFLYLIHNLIVTLFIMWLIIGNKKELRQAVRNTHAIYAQDYDGPLTDKEVDEIIQSSEAAIAQPKEIAR